MEIRKKYVLIFLFALLLVGIFFGILQFGKTKKTMEVNVASLTENENVENEQGVVIEGKEEVGGENVEEQEKKTNTSETLEKNNQEVEIVEEKKPEKTIEKESVKTEKKPETKNESVENGEVGRIVDRLVSWGFAKSSGRKIDTVIIHSSYDSLGNDPYSVSGIIGIYKQYQVAAHYLIDRGGIIHRLVADQNVAWHAGVAKMPDGRTDVNSFSIGIEMINTLDGKYTDEQYEAVNSLLASLKSKYEIRDILGHNEIAPGRKTDPWGMMWNRVDR